MIAGFMQYQTARMFYDANIEKKLRFQFHFNLLKFVDEVNGI